MPFKTSDLRKLTNDLDNLRSELENMKDCKGEELDEALDAERLNEAKTEKLETQIETLEDALVDLKNCISALEDYS